MALPKLSFPPGLFKNGTEYESAARFWDANFIRFHKGAREPIGGWVQKSTSGLSGFCSGVHSWVDLNDTGRLAIGANNALRLMALDGAVTDITPTGYSSTAGQDAVWTLDNGGEQLFGVQSEDGTIYEWSPGDVEAAALSGAPSCQALFVTGEEIVVAVAASGDPRKVAWSDVRNPTQWTASATNFAGDLNIQSAGGLMCGTSVLGGSLIWSTEDLHFMRYVGQPDVYGISDVSDSCGIVGRNAFAKANDTVFWMSQSQFYTFAGVGLVRPLDCTIYDWVFDEESGINRAYAHLAFAWHNEQFNEIWFHFPKGDATTNSHVAVYNYVERHWTHHALEREGGIGRGKGFDYPMLISPGSASVAFVYDHERGNNRGSDRYFLRSGPVELGDGKRTMYVDGLLPDEQTSADVEVDLFTRLFPNGSETAHGPFTVDAYGKVDCMVHGRQAAIRYREKAGQDGSSGKIGAFRASVEPAGEW